MVSKLLIVDDEPPLLRNLSSYLGSFKSEFTVVTASSGEKALSILKDEPEIDVLLTDIRMPGIDGIELVRRAVALNPELRVLVMTAYPSSHVRKKVMSAGALRFLEKPVDVKHLRSMILEVLTVRPGWSGSVGGLDLFDFTQLFLLSGKSKAIQVTHGEKSGVLVFREGNLVHASEGNLNGDDAFYEMATWEGGEFQEISAKRATRYPPNIILSTNRLMMEAARLCDEAHRDEHDQDDLSDLSDDEEGLGNDAVSNAPIFQREENQLEDRNMAIKDHLTDFEEIQGFLGAAVFTAQGEMLEGIAKGKTDIKAVGMFANNALLNAQKATDQMGVGRGNLMQIRAPEAIVLMRCLNEATDFAANKEGKAHFHSVIVLDPEGNTGMATMLLDRAVGKIAEELR